MLRNNNSWDFRLQFCSLCPSAFPWLEYHTHLWLLPIIKLRKGKACEDDQAKGECTLWEVSKGKLVGFFGPAKWNLSGKTKLIWDVSEMIQQEERKNYLHLKNNVGLKLKKKKKEKNSINLPQNNLKLATERNVLLEQPLDDRCNSKALVNFNFLIAVILTLTL